MRIACILLLFIYTPISQAHSDKASSHFLANEAVLVVDGSVKVLFDGFFNNGYGRFPLVPDGMQFKLMTNQPPYDNIDAIFVSHAHGDHFSVEPVLDYLRIFPTVKFYGPQAAVDLLRTAMVIDDKALLKRLNAIDLRPGDAALQIQQNNLLIEAISLSHVGGESMAAVQNLGFRVTLNEKTTVMHLGDADILSQEINLQKEFFNTRTTHTLFPIVFVLENKTATQLIKSVIKPKQIIGIHAPSEAIGKGDQWRERLGFDVFTDPGEIRQIPD